MELNELREGVYGLNEYQELRKDKKGKYRLIFPLKKDGKYIWKNILKIDFTILIILIGFLLVLYNNHINLEECSNIIENPNDFCESFEEEEGGFILNGIVGGQYKEDSIEPIE